MKIYEIFNQEILPAPSKNPNQNQNQNTNKIGDGHFSNVVSNKENPNTVIKTATKHDSAYIAYVRFLMDNKIAQRNPHFPRIYTSAGDKEWEMENLHMTLLDYIVYQSADNEEANERINMICNLYLNKDTHESITMAPKLQDKLQKLMSHLTSKDSIKLQSYKEALKIVNDFIDSDYAFRDDIKAKNIMIRLSPFLQLVFTDPVFSVKDVALLPRIPGPK